MPIHTQPEVHRTREVNLHTLVLLGTMNWGVRVTQAGINCIVLNLRTVGTPVRRLCYGS